MTTDTVSVDRDDLRQLAADLEEAADLGMLAMQERIAELAQRVRAMAGKAEPEGGETWGGLLYTLNTMRKERDEARAEVEMLTAERPGLIKELADTVDVARDLLEALAAALEEVEQLGMVDMHTRSRELAKVARGLATREGERDAVLEAVQTRVVEAIRLIILHRDPDGLELLSEAERLCAGASTTETGEA